MAEDRAKRFVAKQQVAPPARIKEAQRADFRPGYFEMMLGQHGRPTLWEKAAQCACRNNAETGQPNIRCPVCLGLGIEYYDPQTIRVLYENLETNQDTLTAFGTWSFGTARMTMRAEYRPTQRDRYTLLQSVLPYSERRIRRAVRERPRYPIGQVLVDLMVQRPDGEMVKRPSVPRDVLRLRKMDAETLLPGDLLIAGEDFDLVPDVFVTMADERKTTCVGRSIDWSKGIQRGTAPAVGELYAITYLHHPRYEVVTFNSAIRDDWARQKRRGGLAMEYLPLEVMAKLDYDTTQAGAGFGG